MYTLTGGMTVVIILAPGPVPLHLHVAIYDGVWSDSFITVAFLMRRFTQDTA